MSAEIVNLRLVRKRRERLMKEEEAGRNRLLFGETRDARTNKRLAAEKVERDLDARKLEASRKPSPIIDETL
jgi:hypothetical protein